MTPYSPHPGVSFAAVGWSNSSYHFFQAKLTKRFDGGGNVVGQRAVAQLLLPVVREIAVALPPAAAARHQLYLRAAFGRSKRFENGWSKLANAVLGQSQTNGILTLSRSLVQELPVPGNTISSFGG